MPWHAVYVTATGAAVSFATVLPDELAPGLAAVAIDEPTPERAWDAETRSLIAYVPIPADPSGALYEAAADGGRWQWVYAVGPHRLPAAEVGVRKVAPANATAQAHIRSVVAPDEITAAIGWAAARRDALELAITAAGLDPANAPAYADAQGVLAFLGGCL